MDGSTSFAGLCSHPSPSRLMRPSEQERSDRRDTLSDGWCFIAALTTGIYCRPIHPALLPKNGTMAFHADTATCPQVGFWTCKYCRPIARALGSGSPAPQAMSLVATA
ncbi:Ada metal-binding domain-containing protein [Streptomyces sp. NPDC056749]|uniref:Ada metal-binding domain-containing protein n=1 Tax=Streptomyces sp. NPDC056749 TaxID=3345936 RepID=UPI0036948026